MYSVRYKVLVSRTGRKGASILPELKSLPPGTEAFRDNVKWAHFSSLHLESLQQDPSELGPLEFGWTPEGPSGAYCLSELLFYRHCKVDLT